MTGGDWDDAFADDPDAVERERRRAEREARRLERQGSLGEKVRAGKAETTPTGAGEETVSATEPKPIQPQPVTPGARSRTLMLRRVVAAILLIGVGALAVFGVNELIDRLDAAEVEPVPVAAPRVRDLTVPEGLDRGQVAELAEEAELKGDYAEETKRFKGFDLAKYGAQGAPHLEGFLFPATYELPKKGTVRDLVERQLAALEDNLAGIDFSYAKSKNLTKYDVLKIASMVEREIQVPEERRLAAAVIYNRLAAGTPLGIDATIRYEDQNYDEQLVQSRLDQDTPYNTRINPGLPPTPIGNPGFASVEAAANPAKSDAFFFVVKPGTCGEHVFVETQAQFDGAEAEYQAALQAQGGSPTEC